MAIRRRWIAWCDEPGCPSYVVLEREGETILPDKIVLGIQISDDRWDAAPNRDETYCPAHVRHTDEDGWY